MIHGTRMPPSHRVPLPSVRVGSKKVEPPPVIRHVKNVGVVGDGELLHFVHDLPDAGVQILGHGSKSG